MIGTWQVRKLFQSQLEPAPPPLHAGSLKGGVTRGASGLGVLDTEQLNALKATEQLRKNAGGDHSLRLFAIGTVCDSRFCWSERRVYKNFAGSLTCLALPCLDLTCSPCCDLA